LNTMLNMINKIILSISYPYLGLSFILPTSWFRVSTMLSKRTFSRIYLHTFNSKISEHLLICQSLQVKNFTCCTLQGVISGAWIRVRILKQDYGIILNIGLQIIKRLFWFNNFLFIVAFSCIRVYYIL
jgi:hypothetical protein